MSPMVMTAAIVFTCVPLDAVLSFPTLEEILRTNVQCSNSIKGKISASPDIYLALQQKK
jgi:hypothetical protein